MQRILLAIFLSVFAASCSKGVKNEVEVYKNDFEANNLTNITNGITTQFNGSNVLGRYNHNGFTLKLNNLPKHNVVTISFDLYIHDQWGGNKPAPDGPDLWKMLVNENTYISTTFSNFACQPGYFCSPQSYPLDYPNNNHSPKDGAYKTDLPGACSMKGIAGWTTQYKIKKTINHSKGDLILQCLDNLVQTDTTDTNCHESWSIDNVSIKAVEQ